MLSDTIIPEWCLKDGALIGTLFMQHLMSGEDCIHMLSYNYPNGQIYGVVHRDKFVIQVDMGITYSSIIIANTELKLMTVFTRHKGDDLENDTTERWDKEVDSYLPIDLSELQQGNAFLEGMRWLGGILFGLPFGYGILMDSSDQIIYDGFLFQGERVCWGSQFDPASNTLVYDGGWYRNTYCGFGTWRSSRSQSIRRGLWREGELSHGRRKKIVKGSTLSSVHDVDDDSVVDDGSDNDIMCGEGDNGRDLVLSPQKLESIHQNQNQNQNQNSKKSRMIVTRRSTRINTTRKSTKRTKKQQLSANNPTSMTTNSDYPLPLLHSHTEELLVHNRVDNPWSTMGITLHWLVSLRTIIIGDKCYLFVKSLSLYGLNSLETLSIGKRSFSSVDYYQTMNAPYTMSILHCPSLQSIQIKRYAMNNYGRLVLEDLPSLSSVIIDAFCFVKGESTDFRSRIVLLELFLIFYLIFYIL